MVVIGLARSSVCRYPLTNSGRVVEALAHRSMREAGGSEPHKKSAIDTWRTGRFHMWLSRDCLGLVVTAVGVKHT